jgi:integrase
VQRKRRGRHEGGVHKRKDGRWEARWEVGIGSDGRRNRECVYGKSKQEVIEKMLRAKAGVGPDTPEKRSRQTLEDFLEGWLSGVKIANRRATYDLRRRLMKNHVNPLIGGQSLRSLTTGHITSLLVRLKGKNVGERTVQQVYVTLKTALNQAVAQNLISRNPCLGCPKPRIARKAIQIWSVEELTAFLKCAQKTDYYALFVLAVFAGMRQGELFALQWENISLDHAFLSVVWTLTECDGGLTLTEPKTQSSVRRIDLPNFAVDALRQRQGEQKKGFVFAAEGGKPLRKSNFIRRVYHPLMDEAGVPKIRFHSLRHTANSILAMEGTGANVLAERMGHSSTRMTLDQYGHVLPGSQRQAADRLEHVFGNSMFGGQSVVKAVEVATDLPNQDARKSLRRRHFGLVEMRGLEPRTPYMRSKCSTS